MSTRDNLQTAFAGESQANRKYLAFAKQAEKEGFSQIAKLFKAAAAAETVHAHAHLRVMDGVKSTAENIKGAMEGEKFECDQMYPKFVEEARNEDDKRALVSFQNAMAVEQVHFSLYLEASKKLSDGEDMPAAKIYVCSVCGNTVLDSAPDKCPVCGVGSDKFEEID